MTKPFFRHAELTQLQLELKWLISTLAIIKRQRNSLQIERLHLESLKAQGKQESADRAPNVEGPYRSTKNILQFEDSLENMEADCNQEELDLAISKAMLDHQQYAEEYEEEEENCEDMFIDMNMLMHGTYDCNESQKKNAGV